MPKDEQSKTWRAAMAFADIELDSRSTLLRIVPARIFSGNRIRMAASATSAGTNAPRLWIKFRGCIRVLVPLGSAVVDKATGCHRWFYEESVDVPIKASEIAFGAFVSGPNRATIESLELSVAGPLAGAAGGAA